MEELFCQSCGMKLSEEHYSKNPDGSTNKEYCGYCYADGSFSQDVSMDEMIEHCLQYLDDFNQDSEKKFTKDEARAMMKEHFPTLKRWKN